MALSIFWHFSCTFGIMLRHRKPCRNLDVTSMAYLFVGSLQYLCYPITTLNCAKYPVLVHSSIYFHFYFPRHSTRECNNFPSTIVNLASRKGNLDWAVNVNYTSGHVGGKTKRFDAWLLTVNNLGHLLNLAVIIHVVAKSVYPLMKNLPFPSHKNSRFLILQLYKPGNFFIIERAEFSSFVQPGSQCGRGRLPMYTLLSSNRPKLAFIMNKGSTEIIISR